MQVVNGVEEKQQIVIDTKFLQCLIINNVEESATITSHDYFLTENLKTQLTKQEEELKLEYKLWLSDKKKELNKKMYPNEMAKEDAVIAQNREQYLKYNKQLIDIAYQKNLLQGLSRAMEMKANLTISLINSKKGSLYVDEEVAKWNSKVEKTKI